LFHRETTSPITKIVPDREETWSESSDPAEGHFGLKTPCCVMGKKDRSWAPRVGHSEKGLVVEMKGWSWRRRIDCGEEGLIARKMSCNAPTQPHCPPGWHSHCGHSLEAANKESHLLGASQPAPAGLKAGPEHCFSLHMKHLSPLTFLPPLSTDLFGKQTARKIKSGRRQKLYPPDRM